MWVLGWATNLQLSPDTDLPCGQNLSFPSLYSEVVEPRSCFPNASHSPPALIIFCQASYNLFLAVLSLQLFLTLCDSVDYSSPGSPVHGDFPGKDTGVGCHALL